MAWLSNRTNISGYSKELHREMWGNTVMKKEMLEYALTVAANADESAYLSEQIATINIEAAHS
jgi:hypothetical protein